MYNTGTIVALAWPDTKVIREGKWYDVPMKWVGAIKNEYWTVGHAAFLLINNDTGEVHYFDFGRYHTPLMHGRVRDKITDPDIEIKLKAVIQNDKIINLEELLLDRYNHKACHGEGRLTAALVKHIDFIKAYNKVKKYQDREAIPYGPFELKGSTCSRLVAQVVLASTNNWLTKLMIKIPYTVSATPRSNNKVLNDCKYFYEIDNNQIQIKKSKFYTLKKLFTAKRIHTENLFMDLDAVSQLVTETV